MNRRLGKFTTPAALILATALALSACGDKDETSAGDDKPASSAATKAAAAGDTLTKATFFKTLIAAQQKAKTSHMTMEIEAGGQTVKADGDVEIGKSFADNAMSISMDMGAAGLGNMKMIVIDGAFYLNLGQVTQGKYAKIDLTDQGNAFAKQFNQLLDQMDPSKQFEQFSSAVSSLEKKGDAQKIDGVDAQPYELVLDTTKIEGFSNLPGGATSPATVTYTMFMGPDMLLRRMSADIAGANTRVDYSKWGEPVGIKAPPASEISDQDLSQLGGTAPTPAA